MRPTQKSHLLKPFPIPLAVIAISSNLFITSCGGHTSPYSYVNVSVSIAPQITSIPVNGTQAFTATINNAAPYVVWGIMGSQNSSPVGTFTTATTDAPTGTYTAPAAPPTYSAAQLAAGAVQGSVTLSAGVTTTPGSFNLTTTTLTFVITGPISVGVSPATASRSSQQHAAVHRICGRLNQQRDHVAGQRSLRRRNSNRHHHRLRVFTRRRLAIPITGNTITITAVSQTDVTKSHLPSSPSSRHNEIQCRFTSR